MNLKRTITPLALVLTMAVGATPALAQSGNRDGQRRSQARAARPNGGGDRTQSRAAQAPDNRDRGSRAGEAGGRVAVPRAAPGVDDSRRAEIQRNDRGAGNRGYDVGRQDSRVNDSRRAEIQRNDRGAGNRGYDVGRQDSRVNDSRRGEVQRNGRVSGNRGYAVGRQDPRVYDSRRYDDRRYDSRRYDGRVYSNRGYGSGYYGRPYAIRRAPDSAWGSRSSRETRSPSASVTDGRRRTPTATRFGLASRTGG